MNEIYWVAAGDLPLLGDDGEQSAADTAESEGAGPFPQPLPLAERLLAELGRRQVPPPAVDWIWLLPANSPISANAQTGLRQAFPRASTLPLRPALDPAARHCAFAGLLRALLLGERGCALWLEQSSSAWSYVLLASHLTLGRYNLFPQANLLPPAIMDLDPDQIDQATGTWLARQGYPVDTPCVSVSLVAEQAQPAEDAATQGPSDCPDAQPAKAQTLAENLRGLLSSLETNKATYGLLWSPLPGDHLQVLALERA